MAINYRETIFPLAESCRNSYGIHVIRTNEHTQWVCRIEFRTKYFYSQIVELQQAIRLGGVRRNFRRKTKNIQAFGWRSFF